MSERTHDPMPWRNLEGLTAKNSGTLSRKRMPRRKRSGTEGAAGHHGDEPGNNRFRLEAEETAKILASRFLRSARENAGLSQEQLAKRLGRAKGYISQTESLNSSKKVPINYLIEVAMATDTPIFIGSPSELHVSPQEQSLARSQLNRALRTK